MGIRDTLTPLTADEFFAAFDPSIHDKLRALLDRPDVAGMVVFENLQMDSPAFGARSALAFGPGCTYKTPDELRGKRLGDVPSRFEYPTQIFSKPQGEPT